jgi:hypothetical protein
VGQVCSTPSVITTDEVEHEFEPARRYRKCGSASRPGITDAGLSGEHVEGRRIFIFAIVVG